MLWLWWAIRRRGRYAPGLMGAYDAQTPGSTLHRRMTVDDAVTSRLRTCLGLEDRWRCRGLSRVPLAWNAFASFFPLCTPPFCSPSPFRPSHLLPSHINAYAPDQTPSNSNK